MDKNIIICGDCLVEMKKMPDESVDLIYLDPPFFSKKDYEEIWKKDKRFKLKFKDSDWDKLIAEYSLKQEEDAIDERWGGSGHANGIHIFLRYMRDRIEQCHRIIKKNGSIFLHCDWHASHYFKSHILDEIFGYDNFQNEIVWCYNKASSPKMKRLARNHEVIFWYKKGEGCKFYPDRVREEYSESSKKREGYAKISGWTSKGDDVCRLNPKGKFPKDWWEIPYIRPNSKEHIGYPTQKPEELLKRIILMASDEGDLVLDPFCGCGTSIYVAKLKKRNFIGIDISKNACMVMKHRLEGKEIYQNQITPNIIPIIGGETEEELRKINGHKFAELLIKRVGGIVNPKKSGDFGVDGWIENKSVPVQVKNWGRMIGTPDIFRFKTSIEREKKNRGVFYGWDFSGQAKNEVERIKLESGIIIELKGIRNIFNLPDSKGSHKKLHSITGEEVQ